MDKVRVVTFAVGVLGGMNSPINIEHIAAKAKELAPLDFAWKLSPYKEKDWPNPEIVRRALRTAASTNLVCSNKTNWMLTPVGLEWFNANLNLFGPGSKPSSKDADIEIARVKTNKIFKKFINNKLGLIDEFLFLDLLLVPTRTDNKLIEQRFNRLVNLNAQTQDQDMTVFLDKCQQLFGELIYGPDRDSHRSEFKVKEDGALE